MLIVMGVFILAFFGLQFFKSKSAPQPSPSQPAASTSSAPAASSGSAPQNTAAAPAAASSASAATIQANAESQTVVENELYRIQFSNRGAQVTSWILKKYKDADGKPLDLVNKQAAAQFGYPLSLFTYDAGLRDKLSKALFV